MTSLEFSISYYVCIAGKQAFMRVVSKHLDTGEEVEDGSHPPAEPQPSHFSMQADIQARLGQPRVPPNHVPSTKPPPGAGAATHSQFIPPETSAQRFTDWRTQATRGGEGAMRLAPPPPSDQQQQPSLPQQQQPPPQHPTPPQQPSASHPDSPSLSRGRVTSTSNLSEAGSDSSGSSQRSRNAFSREGMQQTIQNVENRWFSNDLLTGGNHDETDSQTPRSRLPSSGKHTAEKPANGPTSPPPSASTTAPIPVPAAGGVPRESSSSPRSDPDNYQEYDSSLDKLNSSLSELQGEIMRLSLQHEQLKATQPSAGEPEVCDTRMSDAMAEIGSTIGANHSATRNTQSRPIHGIPPQAPYQHAAAMMGRHSASPPSVSSPAVPSPTVSTPRHVEAADFIVENHEPPAPEEQGHSQEADNSNSEGFFVSFGNDNNTPIPQRKPRLSERRSLSTSPSRRLTSQSPKPVSQSPHPVMSPHTAAVSMINEADVVPGHAVDLIAAHDGEFGSPGVGFVIKDQTAPSPFQVDYYSETMSLYCYFLSQGCPVCSDWPYILQIQDLLRSNVSTYWLIVLKKS